MGFLVSLLVISGALMHLVSLWMVRKLVGELPQAALQRGWKILGIFISFFFFGYIGFLFLPEADNSGGETSLLSGTLLVPAIFFFGAIFVLLVNLLSLKTTIDLKRICVLEHENITDPLLNIFNRRYLERRLREEMLCSRRHDLPLSILLLDIDKFKFINDTYGHLAGDKVLVGLAKLIRENLRKTDMVARYGGEEIVILLPHTRQDAALRLADKLRRLIESSVLTPANDTDEGKWPDIIITVSIGVAGLDQKVETEKELFALADQALYQAKKSGRNRCVLAGSEEQSLPEQNPQEQK